MNEDFRDQLITDGHYKEVLDMASKLLSKDLTINYLGKEENEIETISRFEFNDYKGKIHTVKGDKKAKSSISIVGKDKTKNYAKLYMNLQGLLSITRLIDGDLYELEYAPGQEPALIIFDKQDVIFYMKSHLKDELMSLNNFQLLKIEPKKCIVCKTIPNNPTEIFNDLDKFKNFQ